MSGLPSDTGRRVAEKLVRLPEQPAFSNFMTRWTKVDTIGRVFVLLALMVVPVWLGLELRSRIQLSAEALRAHDARVKDVFKNAEAWTKPSKATELARHYGELLSLAQNYHATAESFGVFQTVSVVVPVLLFALALIGEYWRFRSVQQLKKAVQFLRTDEGTRLLKEGLPKE